MKKLALSLVAVCLTCIAPATAWAQSGQVARIGYFTYLNLGNSPFPKTFIEELDRFGWTEGKNLTIEWQGIDSDERRIPEVLSVLVALNLDVIVTVTTPITLAAKKANTKTPVVFWGVSDPLGSKIVPSLSQPALAAQT